LLLNSFEVANWVEPLLQGDVPVPRKGAAVSATEGRIVMLGGTSTDAEEKPVVLDEVVVFDIEDTNTMVCSINPVMTGPRPAARTGATMLEYAPGQLLLYGGFGTDGKPLNDAYVLDVDTLAWQRVYNGHPDLVGPQGELTTAVQPLLTVPV
jgi:dynein heavy chain